MAGWSIPPTAFADQVEAEATKRIRIIAMALLREIVMRSPVGNPDLWKANIALRSKNKSLADAYDANVDKRNASRSKGKKAKKLTRRERKENFFVNALASGKGYIGGTFRGSHVVSIGAPDETVKEVIDKTGGATIAAGNAIINGSAPFPRIFIQTNLPYAQKLEDGHSTQAPSGIYGLAFTGVAAAYAK